MKQSLTGWWRLWLLMIAIGASLAVYLTITKKDLGRDGEPGVECIFGTSAIDYRSAFKYVTNPDYANPPLTLDQWGQRHGASKSVVGVTMSMERFKNQSFRQVKSYYSVQTYQCSSWLRLLENLGIALAVSALIVALGFAGAWVIKGFKS